MRTFSLALISLALTGCATWHHLTDPRTRYVGIYCLTKPQYEQLKQSQPGKVHGSLTGQADKDLETVTGNLIRVRAHDDGLLEVLGGCVDPKTTEAPAK